MKIIDRIQLNIFGISLALLLPTVLGATSLAAQTPLLEVFAACEESVVEGSDRRLREVGTLIDKSEKGSRIRVDTPKGTVLAMFLPPTRMVSACLLWGRHPKLAAEFQEHWVDWVEWEEAADASGVWLSNAMEIPGSVDLSDHSRPGYVVARCNVLEHGLVLASQPAVANVMRQVLPKLEPEREPVIHYQFSVTSALPGRCLAGVKAQKEKN